MAVRIDIPGIGVVEAEGIASEETLQRLAAALEKSSAGLTKDQKDQAKATKDSTKAIKENTTGWVAAGDAFTQSLKNMALTATSVATKFFANYDTIAASPIKAGQSLLNTAIDLTANLAGGLAGSIPVIGGFAKGVIDATAALAKMANDIFADQLQKNVDALREYAKTGIGFSGGMTQMQNAAQSAGLGIKDFAQGVTKVKSDLNLLGMAGGDAAAALAKNLGQLAKKGPGGLPSLRDEIFKMGFSYEQQIEVAASYMANMKASGRLEKMTTEELAKGTRDYARDLKVIADFTGKDALKVQERARAATQRASVLQQLDTEQRERYKSGLIALEKLPNKSVEAQQALTQMVLAGTTNIEGFTMGPQRQMIEQLANDIKNGTGDIMTNSAAYYNEAIRGIAADRAQGAMSFSKAFGVGGVAGAASDVGDAFLSLVEVSADQIKNSKNANEAMASSTEKLASSVATLYDSAQAFKVQVEGITNSHLDTYSKILADNFKRIVDVITGKGLGGGGSTGTPGFPKLSENPMVPVVSGPGIKKYADGGTLGSGQFGLVGEAGPELISGPAGVTNAKQMRENMARLFDETAKMLVNAKNPFRTALDDVAWTDAGDMSIPYDKVTGTILDPNFVKDLSDKAKGWQDASAMLSEKFSKDSATMAKSDMGEGLDSGFLSDTNRQVLELLQQTRDAATQQTMHMADMLKQMGISTDRLGKIAVNTN